METQVAQPQASQIFTVEQFAAAEPAFKESSIRWLIFNRDRNGLEQSGALIRVGRRVLIDRQKFLGWLMAQQQSARAA
jgi:hypothetical protein